MNQGIVLLYKHEDNRVVQLTFTAASAASSVHKFGLIFVVMKTPFREATMPCSIAVFTAAPTSGCKFGLHVTEKKRKHKR